uniref:Rhodanese domain-containing protein n=1 Tax=Oryza rufipogon TaxID=4529 RepID=A0A0E0QP06_ORYRU
MDPTWHNHIGPSDFPPLFLQQIHCCAVQPCCSLLPLLQKLHKITPKKIHSRSTKESFANLYQTKMAVLGLSTAFSPPRGSCIAVRIRHGARSARSNLSLRRGSAGGGAIGVRAEVSFVDGDEAKRLVAEEGYTVLDIRDRTQRERAHIKNSAHVPLFVENDDGDIGTIIKRTVHNNFAGLFFGLPFTKRNLEFTKMVKDKFSPESKLLVVCQEGLRSTGAADVLEREGFQNLACIKSGLQTLKPGAYLFITLFPDQAEKLFDLAGIKL